METRVRADHTIFARSEQRVIAGVAGGLGEYLGVNPWVVRVGFIVMALGSGVGLVLYGLCYVFSGPIESTPHPVTTRHNVGFALISVAIGLGGVRFMADNIGRVFSLRSVWLAALITLVAAVLIAGPWLLRLISQVEQERRDRIRSEERADLSAHLHDSVLNTLALIQRSEAKPEVVMLARRQERELRAWMQGRPIDEDVQLDAAIDALASDVEGHYNVSIDAVVVGGGVPLDDRVNSFVSAIREAAINAARHSGVNTVSIYVEVDDAQISAFVRDQGKGFDRAHIGEDRRGISDSIEGRMKRIGGTTAIRSTPGEGTEVELQLSRMQK